MLCAGWMRISLRQIMRRVVDCARASLVQPRANCDAPVTWRCTAQIGLGSFGSGVGWPNSLPVCPESLFKVLWEINLRLILGFCALLFVLASASCAVSKGAITSYVEPTYQAGSIKRLAILSIRNASRAPAEARAINVKVTQAIVAKNPSIEVVSPAAALEAINGAGLAKDWADYLNDYYTSGIANRVILERIAKALSVDAIMQGQLVNVHQEDGNGWSKLGVTRVTVSYSIVEVATAKQIWEATADGIKTTSTEFEAAPPIAEAIQIAIDKILQNIPNL